MKQGVDDVDDDLVRQRRDKNAGVAVNCLRLVPQIGNRKIIVFPRERLEWRKMVIARSRCDRDIAASDGFHVEGFIVKGLIPQGECLIEN